MTSVQETTYAAVAAEDLEAYMAAFEALDPRGTPHKSATERLAQEWNADPDPVAFYSRASTGQLYLEDLTAWHSGGSINPWFGVVYNQLKDRSESLVLDYGAGIGTYSLLAADLGHVVHACDVSPELREYTAWRAKRHKLDIVVMDQPMETGYDVILCMDVIEHLPEPEAFPAFAAGLLRPGGVLICTWTFHDSGGLHPMHHGPEHQEPFNAALGQHFSVAQAGWPVVLTARHSP